MEMFQAAPAWHFDALIIGLMAGIFCLHYVMTGFSKIKQNFSLLLTMLLFFVSECSPVHQWSMAYFSVHMITHVIELLICGPLLLISLSPVETSGWYSKVQKLSLFISSHNWLAWLCGVAIMWFWHIPAIFNDAMGTMNQSFSIVPVAQAGTMLMGGMLFSWPLFSPIKTSRIQPLSGIVYLFTACISCSLLGLIITFAPLNTWNFHHTMMMNPANEKQLSPAQDQQAAGLIMWVPCCFVYLSGCFILLYRWFAVADLPLKKSDVEFNNSL